LQIIYRTSQPNSLWHPASDKNRVGRYERVRKTPKEVTDPDKMDMNSNTWKEDGYTDLQMTQPHSIYATVNKGDKGIHVGVENKDIHAEVEKKAIHVGAENNGFDHEEDRHSLGDGKRSTDGGHSRVEHSSDVSRSRSSSIEAHGDHYDTAAF